MYKTKLSVLKYLLTNKVFCEVNSCRYYNVYNAYDIKMFILIYCFFHSGKAKRDASDNI